VKILVVGSGGREHALVWKLKQSESVETVYCAPGNGGISREAECAPIPVLDTAGLITFVNEKKIDLTVVGPEAPLTGGIVDTFEEKGLSIFGPRRSAAILEGSKVYAKNFMIRYEIPTASCFIVYGKNDSEINWAREYARENPQARVVKADGLAAGKGVLVCSDYEEVESAIDEVFIKKSFGDAGNQFIIEEKLTGEEISILLFLDGSHCVPMLPSQDYKQIFEGDTGPNTGGMGAFAPVPFLSESDIPAIYEKIIGPTVRGLKNEEIEYKGVLYLGLMLTSDGPKVLEFNCRFGDPETQPILYLLKTDLVEVIQHTIHGTLDQVQLEWGDGYAACIVAASKGYPGAYEKGKLISGLDSVPSDIKVFHAGTKYDDGNYLTNGGRVLGVTGHGVTFQEALDRAYAGLKQISFEGMYYRKDIGFRVFRNE